MSLSLSIHSSQSEMKQTDTTTDQDVDLLVTLLPIIMHHQLTAHQKNKQLLDNMQLLHLQPIPNTEHVQYSLPTLPSLIAAITSLLPLQTLLRDHSKFYRHTRLNVIEFLILHQQLEDSLRNARATRESPSHTAPHITSRRLTSAEQLLMWMMAVHGEGLTSLELLYHDIDSTTVFRNVDHVTRCINTHFERQIAWPDASERKRLYGLFSVCDTVIAAMDGTHCEIERPAYESSKFWNGHKKKHTQNYIVCVNVFGVVVFVSGPYAGAWNDRGCYNQCRVATDTAEFVTDEEKIIADGGFMGGHPLLVPLSSSIIKRARDEVERNKMYIYNLEVSENRVLVEDVFAWLKATARVLERRFNRKRHEQGKIFYAVCRWHNAIRRMRIAHVTK